MKVRRTSTAAWLLAGWAAASVGCGENTDHLQPRTDAAAMPNGDNVGADAGGTGTRDAAPVGFDAAMPADAATAAGDAAMPADAATAAGDASVDGSTAGAKRWWEATTLTPLSWLPSDCVVSVLDDPSQIPPLEWQPFALPGLMGKTPVVPPGWTFYRYRELANGASWMSGNVSDESVVEVRDGAGAGLFGFKARGCSADDIASTSRGICVHFGFRKDDRGLLACGDLRKPNPLLKVPKFGFVYASSDELVMIKKDLDHGIFIVDLSDDSVHDTNAAGSFAQATAYGRDAFAIHLTSGALPHHGIINHWNGDNGYEMIWDPVPLGAINVHVTAGQLVWTETEVDAQRTGTSIYRAPWPPSGATLDPTLVRKINLVSFEGRSALAAGQLAIRAQDRIELIDLDDATRRTVSMGDRWNASSAFLNDRSLVIWMFDSPDVSKYVSFRANLSDVMALPAD